MTHDFHSRPISVTLGDPWIKLNIFTFTKGWEYYDKSKYSGYFDLIGTSVLKSKSIFNIKYRLLSTANRRLTAFDRGQSWKLAASKLQRK